MPNKCSRLLNEYLKLFFLVHPIFQSIFIFEALAIKLDTEGGIIFDTFLKSP